MMKKTLTAVLAVALTVSLSACNEQIPAGHLGKIMGKTGFQPEIYPPSKVWLDQTFTMTPEELFLVETTTQKYSQPVNIKLSEEKLNINVEVTFRGRISTNDKIINTIFNDMKMDDHVITTDEVYEVYGRELVTNTARAVISKYNVDEIPKNFDRITKELFNALQPKLQNLPIELSEITIGKIDYPEVVEESIRTATQRRMAIEKEEAEVQIKLTEARGREELAKAEYSIKMMEAKRIRDYNEITAKGITADLLKLRELELREKELEKWNGALPTTLMGGNVPVIVNTK
jgi:hypothetical protein